MKFFDLEMNDELAKLCGKKSITNQNLQNDGSETKTVGQRGLYASHSRPLVIYARPCGQ